MLELRFEVRGRSCHWFLCVLWVAAKCTAGSKWALKVHGQARESLQVGACMASCRAGGKHDVNGAAL